MRRYELLVDPAVAVAQRKSASATPATSSDHQPIDAGGLVYKIMFLQGVGLLFPWNAFITASAYYEVRFCGQSFQVSFENYFTFAFTLAQTVGLAWSIKYQNRLSWFAKIISPLALQTLIFMAAAIVAGIYMDPQFLFGLTMIQTFVCGALGAIFSSGLYGVAGTMPSQYTGAVMNGSGLAGLSVSVSSILTSLATTPKNNCANDLDDDATRGCNQFSVDYGAFAYFLVAAVLLLTCMIAYYTLTQLDFAKHYTFIGRHEISVGGDAQIRESTGCLNINGPSGTKGEKGRVVSDVLNDIQSMEFHAIESGNDTQCERCESISPLDHMIGKPDAASASFATIFRVFRDIAAPAICVTLTFVITLSLFPSLTVLIESVSSCQTESRWQNDLFTPMLFLLFNIFDFLGRVCAGMFPVVFTTRTISIPTLGRLVFFPLFALCNIRGSRLASPFNSDLAPIVIMALFAFSGGFCASSCMMLGPASAAKNDGPLAGTIMVFCLTVGLLCGSLLSFAVLQIARAP